MNGTTFSSFNSTICNPITTTTTCNLPLFKVWPPSSPPHTRSFAVVTALLSSTDRDSLPSITSYTAITTDDQKQKKKKIDFNNIGTNSPTLSQLSPIHLLTTLYLKLTNFIDPPLHPSVDPKHVLTGNFAPVDEHPPTDCPVVEGELPLSLNGTYVRNGPNPQHPPHGPHHIFEGDGMLHSIRLSRGGATFCSRYVKTYKYTLEQDAGLPIFPNILSGFYSLADLGRCAKSIARVMVGQINLSRGFGLANTSLSFFSNKLFALGESDLPYAVRLTPQGDIETIGRCDLDGNKKLFMNMTAHPKIDKDTGEVFAFRCNPFLPYLTFFRFDAKGSKHEDVPILSINRPAFVHDFAITKRYAVFIETQLEISPLKLIMAKGTPLETDPSKASRIGVIPRYASSESEMKWFGVPGGFNALHVINAWEDDEEAIVLVAPDVVPIEKMFDEIDTVHFSLEKVRINTRSGEVSRTILSRRSLELGTVNPAYIGKKNRYVYMGMSQVVPKMSGVVKIDLELEHAVSSRLYEPGIFGGEPFFVARDDEEGDPLRSDEDDGYVVCFVHNESTGESRFEVMDAKSPELEVVAAVKLPRRVPYGFHGLFVSEKDVPFS